MIKRSAILAAGCALIPGSEALPVNLRTSYAREVRFTVCLLRDEDGQSPAPRRVGGLPPRRMWDVVVNVDTLAARLDDAEFQT